MTAWPPVSSQDVEEAREAAVEANAAAEFEETRRRRQEAADLARCEKEKCVDGWLGGFDVEHPRPCPVHKRHLLVKLPGADVPGTRGGPGVPTAYDDRQPATARGRGGGR